MKNRMLLLVAGIPMASILLGMVLLYFAVTGSDSVISTNETALSKTSWQTRGDAASEGQPQ